MKTKWSNIAVANRCRARPARANALRGRVLVQIDAAREHDRTERSRTLHATPEHVGELALRFSPVPFVVGRGTSIDGSGCKIVTGVIDGSSAHTCLSRSVNGALQFLVIALPLQCASTSE